jgi:hypothetical protein
LLATVLLLCTLPAALAQQGEPEKAAETSAKKDQPPSTRTTPEPGEPPPGKPADNADQAFDYEASEKISEDLSVSFPVDI